MRNFFIKYFPYLGVYKRFFVALVYAIQPTKKTYSQHNEDEYFFEILSNYNLDKVNDIYVDIGANHPMDISNTYLFYRNGFHGIAIDPNTELIQLFKIFRKKDLSLALGCSNQNSVLKFKISKTPVVSSFLEKFNVDIFQEYYCPIIKIDDLLKNMDFNIIFFLSIDVEGLNFEVLQGSLLSLTRVLLLCIEYEDKEQAIRGLMEQNGFEFIKNISNCNLIFINKSLKEKIKKI